MSLSKVLDMVVAKDKGSSHSGQGEVNDGTHLDNAIKSCLQEMENVYRETVNLEKRFHSNLSQN